MRSRAWVVCQGCRLALNLPDQIKKAQTYGFHVYGQSQVKVQELSAPMEALRKVKARSRMPVSAAQTANQVFELTIASTIDHARLAVPHFPRGVSVPVLSAPRSVFRC